MWACLDFKLDCLVDGTIFNLASNSTRPGPRRSHLHSAMSCRSVLQIYFIESWTIIASRMAFQNDSKRPRSFLCRILGLFESQFKSFAEWSSLWNVVQNEIQAHSISRESCGKNLEHLDVQSQTIGPFFFWNSDAKATGYDWATQRSGTFCPRHSPFRL